MHSNILAKYIGLTETLHCMEHARETSFGHQLRRVCMYSWSPNSVIAWCQRVCMLVRARKRTLAPSQYIDCLSWYRDSHYKDEMVWWQSSGNPYSGKTLSLYWDGPLIKCNAAQFSTKIPSHHYRNSKCRVKFNGLTQNWGNSSVLTLADVLELPHSCAKPSRCLIWLTLSRMEILYVCIHTGYDGVTTELGLIHGCVIKPNFFHYFLFVLQLKKYQYELLFIC